MSFKRVLLCAMYYVLCARCCAISEMCCVLLVLDAFVNIGLEAWNFLKLDMFRIVVMSMVLDVFCYVLCIMCYVPGVVQYQICVYFLCFISFVEHWYASLEIIEMGIADFTQVL